MDYLQKCMCKIHYTKTTYICRARTNQIVGYTRDCGQTNENRATLIYLPKYGTTAILLIK